MWHKLLSSDRYNQFKLFCLDQLLPLSCLLCHQPCHHPMSLCLACQTLISIPDGLSQIEVSDNTTLTRWQSIRCLAAYESPIKELILLGKFQKNLAALKMLGFLFANIIAAQGYDPELVLIPVPLHKNRLLLRGYNQALEIALPIAKKLDLKINNHCIYRAKEAQTQHFLSRKQRADNAQDIFQVKHPIPKKIAVIDDIFTTGSTMQSLCACLYAAGAETIEVWIIARTLKQSSGILACKSTN